MGSYNYVFLYNVVTGAVTDPLANVPGLFAYGICMDFVLNDAATRAVVEVYTDTKAEDFIGYYVCDLTTGEMTPIGDIAAAYFPETQGGRTILGSDYGNFRWTDDDTLAFSISVGGDNVWLCGCNLASESVLYQKKVSGYVFGGGSNRYVPIVQGSSAPEEIGNQYGFWDKATGQTYYFDGLSFTSYFCSFSVDDRHALVMGEAPKLYWVDLEQMAWADLSDTVSTLTDGGSYETLSLLGSDWLCLTTTDETILFYHIPEELSMTPLTAGAEK